jgi:hypothetical protein
MSDDPLSGDPLWQAIQARLKAIEAARAGENKDRVAQFAEMIEYAERNASSRPRVLEIADLGGPACRAGVEQRFARYDAEFVTAMAAEAAQGAPEKASGQHVPSDAAAAPAAVFATPAAAPRTVGDALAAQRGQQAVDPAAPAVLDPASPPELDRKAARAERIRRWRNNMIYQQIVRQGGIKMVGRKRDENDPSSGSSWMGS